MRDNRKRRAAYARKRQLYEQLRLQADILCDSHDERKEAIILSRMTHIILGMTSARRLNNVTRQALADHFVDCAQPGEPTIELGGPYDRNSLYLNGSFRVDDLAKRVVWTQSRTDTTIENTY
jgi:hypothetical protein